MHRIAQLEKVPGVTWDKASLTIPSAVKGSRDFRGMTSRVYRIMVRSVGAALIVRYRLHPRL